MKTAPKTERDERGGLVKKTLDTVPLSEVTDIDEAYTKPLMAMLLTDPLNDPDCTVIAPDTFRLFPLMLMLEME